MKMISFTIILFERISSSIYIFAYLLIIFRATFLVVILVLEFSILFSDVLSSRKIVPQLKSHLSRKALLNNLAFDDKAILFNQYFVIVFIDYF